MNESESWEIVCTASGMVYANILKGRLESEGIPVRLLYEAAGEIYGLTIDGLGKVDILVPVAFLEEARRSLETYYREEDMEWQEKNH